MSTAKKKKIISFIGISLGGIIVGLVISFYIMLYLSVPVTDGRIKIPEIHSNIEITYDSLGIPQIWAENSYDAYFALGYQHASDRMFQIDLSRRVASGKLSQMMGEATLEYDIAQRKKGHLRMAREALDNLSDENRTRLEAYTAGINSYRLRCRAYPFEYRFLPIDFQPWEVVDCLALLSFQTWFSNALMNRDAVYMELAKIIGEEKAATLVFDYPEWAPVTVEGAKISSTTTNEINYPKFTFTEKNSYDKSKTNFVQGAILENLFSNGQLPFRMTNASNGWVVAPEKSASGHAMLAGDPHLETARLPQFWYAVGIHIKDSLDVLGITTPGLPFVVMGHNGQAAWTFTVGGIDLTDYYSESINPEDSNFYLSEDGYKPFIVYKDSIEIMGQDSLYSFEVIYTDHGPVIAKDTNENKVYSIHWAGYDIDLDKAVSSAFDFASTENFEQFQKTVTGFGALDVNMLYADAEGNIGYQLTSPIPDRNGKQILPMPGDQMERWNEFYPLEQTPNLYNPPDGWIASCNNLPMRADYIYGYFFADRILRIHELLQSKEKFTPDDMADFQLDRTDSYLMRMKEELTRILSLCGNDSAGEMIKNWDGSTEVDSRATALIITYLNRLKKYTFEDELGEQYGSLSSRWVEQLEQVENAGWFDDVNTEDTIENYDDIAQTAMKEALTTVNNRSWGEMSTVTMEHTMSTIPVLGSLLGLKIGPESHSGTTGSLNASFTVKDDQNNFHSKAGPSWRFVVDFADVDQVQMVLPAGNSGNPMSTHFNDFYPLWKSGKYWTVPFSYEKVKARSESILILEAVKK